MSGPGRTCLRLGTVVHRDPEILDGTPVFVGTRVPVDTLTDHLAGGISLDEFLEDFPSVQREQAIAFLRHATEGFLDRFAS